MFCTNCGILIKNHAFIYDSEEFCSSDCLAATHDEIEGDLDKYIEEWEEEYEEFSENS